ARPPRLRPAADGMAFASLPGPAGEAPPATAEAPRPGPSDRDGPIPVPNQQGGTPMGLVASKELNSIEDLLLDQLGDLYDAEQRLTKALPKMACAATDPKLKAGFEQHLRETEGQVRRLEQAFKALGKDPKAVTCDAMKGLISEGDHVVNA